MCDDLPPGGGDGRAGPRGASEGAGGRVWAGFAALPCTQPARVDVAAGTPASLTALKKKGGEDSREGKPGGKRIKNSPHELAEPLVARTDDFI